MRMTFLRCVVLTFTVAVILAQQIHADDNSTTFAPTDSTSLAPTSTTTNPETSTQVPQSTENPTGTPTPGTPTPGTPTPGTPAPETPAPPPGGLAGDLPYTENQKFGISCATFACLAAAWALFCFTYGKVADRCSPEPDGPKYAQVPQANQI